MTMGAEVAEVERRIINEYQAPARPMSGVRWDDWEQSGCAEALPRRAERGRLDSEALPGSWPVLGGGTADRTVQIAQSPYVAETRIDRHNGVEGPCPKRENSSCAAARRSAR